MEIVSLELFDKLSLFMLFTSRQDRNILSMSWFLFRLFAAMSVFHCTPIRRNGRNPSSWNSEVRSLIFPRTYSPSLLSQFEEWSEQSQPLLSPQSSHQNILTNMGSFLRSSRTILHFSIWRIYIMLDFLKKLIRRKDKNQEVGKVKSFRGKPSLIDQSSD